MPHLSSSSPRARAYARITASTARACFLSESPFVYSQSSCQACFRFGIQILRSLLGVDPALKPDSGMKFFSKSTHEVCGLLEFRHSPGSNSVTQATHKNWGLRDSTHLSAPLTRSTTNEVGSISTKVYRERQKIRPPHASTPTAGRPTAS